MQYMHVLLLFFGISFVDAHYKDVSRAVCAAICRMLTVDM